ncbi:heavy metal sensor histidine kinase [Cupriavidus necator]|uniref:heavy metal sensor histidine kinase n=1 Tax=Cupriavidus necator TaxID=106590 RepID=UPI0005B4E616|nr:heavy metal sensor histidine kinase [Cupriavidus necator]
MRSRLSLTVQLALAFALVAGVAFAGVGTYLYKALTMQVVARDDAELLRKVERVRDELAERFDSDADRWREIGRVVSGNDEYALRVQSASGSLLTEANFHGESVPDAPPMPEGAALGPESIRAWRTPEGYQIRGVALLARPQDNGAPVKVTVSQVARSRFALMREYRWKLVWATLLGSLSVGLLGYAAVRAGMAPLRRIATGTRTVTFSSVALPIDPARLPVELKELAHALQQMIERLHESYHRLSQFSADLAHDFRTPLGNLLGQTQVALSAERGTEEYQALLASNVEEYERLSRMIENMLFLARADNARVAMHVVELDLESELHRVADYFDLLADAKQVSIRVQAAGKVFADAGLLRRALSNLVSNAVRYTPAGEQIVLTARQADGYTHIEVSNPGPGIAAEHLPKLFERFFRGDPARANSGASSGIGLAIVKTIMDLHQGKVGAESASAAMTRFRLSFPLRGGAA